MDDMILRLMRLKAQGFCCAQIILILALQAQGKTDADLVRSVGGLCFGIYGSGEVCGALSGGACLISLYAGKGSVGETPHKQYVMMVAELAGWFRETTRQYGGTECDEILDKSPDRSVCGRIVADTYEKCMEILANHGFDPAVGRT